LFNKLLLNKHKSGLYPAKNAHLVNTFFMNRSLVLKNVKDSGILSPLRTFLQGAV